MPPLPETPAQARARVVRRAALSLGYNNGINAATNRTRYTGMGTVDSFRDGMAVHMDNRDPTGRIKGVVPGMNLPPNFSALWSRVGGNTDRVYNSLNVSAPVIFTGRGGATVTILRMTVDGQEQAAILIDGVDLGNKTWREGRRDVLDIARQNGFRGRSLQIDDINDALAQANLPANIRFTVVGHSHGAAVAVDWARRNMGRVDAVELYDPQGPTRITDERMLNQAGVRVDTTTTFSDFLTSGFRSADLNRTSPGNIFLGPVGLFNGQKYANVTITGDYTPDSKYGSAVFSHTWDTLAAGLAEVGGGLTVPPEGWTTQEWQVRRAAQVRALETDRVQTATGWRAPTGVEIKQRMERFFVEELASRLNGQLLQTTLAKAEQTYTVTDTTSGRELRHKVVLRKADQSILATMVMTYTSSQGVRPVSSDRSSADSSPLSTAANASSSA
jgi:pimeloyl-ACP methyl ester carboxylesterase